jgi:hypothetical protein
MATKLLYHFNESIADSSGNGKDLTAVGTTNYNFGQFGSAVGPFTNTDYLQVTTPNAISGYNDFTLEFFMSFKTQTNVELGSTGLLFKIADSVNIDMQISFTSTNRLFFCRFNNATWNHAIQLDAGIVDDGLFHHVAIVRDTTTVTYRVYIDGVIKMSFADSSYSFNNLPITIGNDFNPTSALWASDSLMDEFRITNTVEYTADFTPPTQEFTGVINMLTGIENAAKGATATITLDKAVLFALASVVGDGYFAVEADVKKAVISYKSSVGNQHKELSFVISETSPTAPLAFSAYARTTFDIARITLFDFDGGFFEVAVGDIPTLTITLA